MRLIDADALICGTSNVMPCNDLNIDCGFCQFYDKEEHFCLLEDWIYNAPTIEAHGDLISRADAIALLTKIVFEEPPYFDSETLCRLYAEEQINTLPSAEIKGANLINRHDATTVIREECLKCNNLTNADLLGRILSLPTSQQTDCTEFIMWLIEVVLDDEDWELNAVSYGEIIARKLKKLGLLEVKDGYYIRHIENNTKESDLVYRPSAEAEKIFCSPDAEWIPCSERLPSAEDCPMDCMVTRRSQYVDNYTDMAVAEADGTWTHEDWKAITIKGEATCISTRDADIIAWMPLPTPYKGGENE